MRTISRSQAISDLRCELLKLVDREHSLCQVAARRGLFCNGFGRWSTEELERRTPHSTHEPEATRDEIERTFILATLTHFEGDKRRAADVLGCSLTTLYHQVHAYQRERTPGATGLN